MSKRLWLTVYAMAFFAFAVWSFPFFYEPFKRPPLVGRNLPKGYEAGNEEFQRRLAAEYPLPMPVDELASGLSAAGFSVNVDRRIAVFKRGMFFYPCETAWRVIWDVEDGAAVNLRSLHGRVCP